MFNEIVETLLVSLGGASVIVAGFAHFLGKIWTDRIAKATTAKFNIEMEAIKSSNTVSLENIKTKNIAELELIKSSNTIALEEFKRESSVLLSDKEQFGGISHEFYQEFFKDRVETYSELLKIKNNYITQIHEEFITEIHEGWGNVFYSTYVSLRKLMIEKQLYISNELETLFSELRIEASEHIREVDLEEAYSSADETPPYENERLSALYDKLATSTGKLMKNVMEQIGTDVSKLKSRIELDKA